jgi:hypothetical protein
MAYLPHKHEFFDKIHLSHGTDITHMNKALNNIYLYETLKPEKELIQHLDKKVHQLKHEADQN